MKLTRENLFTFLNLHLLVLGALAIGNLVLLTRLVLAWNTLRADRPEQIAALHDSLKTAQLRIKPLEGLPQKVEASAKQATKFFDARVPANYSSISAELNELAQKTTVRLSRVAYTPVPVADDLEEVRMDASLSGEYTATMRFINGLERDKLFFIVNGLQFTGQQGGTVNLRLRVTTYIHASNADQLAPPNTGPAGGAANGSDDTPSAALRPLAKDSAAGGQ